MRFFCVKMKKISRQDAIYQIALAGVCAAVSLLLVWLSVLVRYSTVAFYVAAGLVLMIPMTQKYYLSSVFAYIVSAVLGFVIAGDIVTVSGYVIYFAPISIITAFLCNKKIKWWISLIVKIVYINGALALLYFVCNTIVIDASIMEKLNYWLIALVGTVILVAIDFVVQLLYSRIGRIMSRVLRKRKDNKEMPVADEDEQTDAGEYPFDDDM